MSDPAACHVPCHVALPYRRNVGAVLFNRDGKVFVARRADLPNAEGAPGGWQLPQGGIDADEDPRPAVLRELAEEIGTDHAEIIGEHPDWLTYDLPPELVGVALARALSRSASALVRVALHRRGQRHQPGSRSASGIRCLALGGAERAAGAGGGFQAADLSDPGAIIRPFHLAVRHRAAPGAAPPLACRWPFRPWYGHGGRSSAAPRRWLRPAPGASWPRSEVDARAHPAILLIGPHTQPGEPMGNTIDLKAADGFTLSAYTAGPARSHQGDRGDPGDFRR